MGVKLKLDDRKLGNNNNKNNNNNNNNNNNPSSIMEKSANFVTSMASDPVNYSGTCKPNFVYGEYCFPEITYILRHFHSIGSFQKI